LSTLNHLARAYQAAGEPSRAEALARDSLVRQWKNGHVDSLAVARSTLGEILLKQTKYAEAEPLLRESLAEREQRRPDDGTTCHTRSVLGGAMLGQGKYAEAEPLLLQGYEGMKHRAARIPALFRSASLTEALERLAQLATDWGKPDEAVRWR